jgi:hypothetical protein
MSNIDLTPGGVGCIAWLGLCPRCNEHAVICSNNEMISRPGYTTVMCAKCDWHDAIPVVRTSHGTVKSLPVRSARRGDTGCALRHLLSTGMCEHDRGHNR